MSQSTLIQPGFLLGDLAAGHVVSYAVVGVARSIDNAMALASVNVGCTRLFGKYFESR